MYVGLDDGEDAGSAGRAGGGRRDRNWASATNPFVVLSGVLAVVVVALSVLLGLAVQGKLGGSGNNQPNVVDDTAFSFVHLTDLHLDPLSKSHVSCEGFCRDTPIADWATSSCSPNTPYRAGLRSAFDAPFGRIGCDAPVALVDSAVESAAAVKPPPAFVIVTGDMAGHSLCGNSTVQQTCKTNDDNHTFVNYALEHIANKVHSSFANVPVVMSLGNNDLLVHYETPTGVAGAAFLKRLSDLWQPLARCAGCSNPPAGLDVDFSTFQPGGYYSVSNIAPGLRVLALNTLLFISMEGRSSSTYIAEQQRLATDHMAWIATQLAAARAASQSVTMTSHIPWGMQPFSDKPTWNSTWQQRFFDTIEKYSDIVTTQMYGHFHYDTVRAHGTVAAAFLAPSVSPISRSNAAFRIVKGTKGSSGVAARVSDYDQYYADVTGAMQSPVQEARETLDWRLEYTFSKTYGLTASVSDVAKVPNLLKTSSEYYSDFVSNHGQRYQPFRWHYACAVAEADATGYENCLSASKELWQYDVSTINAPR